MFVMDLMSTPDSAGIPVIGISKHLKPLMDKDIVYQKISKPVSKYSQAYWQTCPEAKILPGCKTGDTYNGVKNKEGVVALPPVFVIFHVVIFMKHPKKSMHDVFMGKPCHKLHRAEGR
jgi:hypothetical protein